MSAVIACGQSKAVAVSRLGAVMLAFLSFVCSGAIAAEDDMAPTVIAQANITMPGERTWPQLEVSASTLPRFDSVDSANSSSRVDMTWLPPRRSALGLSLGMTTMDGASMSPMSPSASPFAQRTGLTPSVDLGLRWRYTLDNNYRVDVTAWRRMVPADALTLVQTREASYGARVEMQMGSSMPKSGFVAERGFLGLQLESGARVTLRRNGGKPMIYYRNKF